MVFLTPLLSRQQNLKNKTNTAFSLRHGHITQHIDSHWALLIWVFALSKSPKILVYFRFRRKENQWNWCVPWFSWFLTLLKFGYSEKATKFETSNLKWKIFSNFVAFSEYPNFTWKSFSKQVFEKVTWLREYDRYQKNVIRWFDFFYNNLNNFCKVTG